MKFVKKLKIIQSTKTNFIELVCLLTDTHLQSCLCAKGVGPTPPHSRETPPRQKTKQFLSLNLVGPLFYIIYLENAFLIDIIVFQAVVFPRVHPVWDSNPGRCDRMQSLYQLSYR